MRSLDETLRQTHQKRWRDGESSPQNKTLMPHKAKYDNIYTYSILKSLLSFAFNHFDNIDIIIILQKSQHFLVFNDFLNE